MKNKFLVLAMATAILATFALPGVGWAATSADDDSASAEIGVTASTDLTITLNGKSASAAFLLEPFTANDTDSIDWALATDSIVVLDHTGDAEGKDGHMVSVVLNTVAWAYSGSVGSAPDADVFTTFAGTPGSDELLFRFNSAGGTYYTNNAYSFHDDAGDACTPSVGVVGAQSIALTTTEQEILTSAETCPGSVYYAPVLDVTGPSNGLYAGQYTISGTYILYDDSDTSL